MAMELTYHVSRQQAPLQACALCHFQHIGTRVLHQAAMHLEPHAVLSIPAAVLTMLWPMTEMRRSEGLSCTYALTSSARRLPQVSMPSRVCACCTQEVA